MERIEAMGTDADRQQGRWALAVGLVGVAWIALHGAGLLGSLSNGTFVVLGITALTATIVGLRTNRPARRWPFVLLACACFLFLVGGALRQQFETLGDLTPHRSLIPDFLAAPGYLLLGLALAGIGRYRRGTAGFDLDATLDASVAALAALVVSWAYLISPALANDHAPLRIRLILAAYPALSAFLVVTILQIAFVVDDRRVPAHRLLVAALGCMFIGDVVYMLEDAHIAALSLHVIDVPYALAFLCFSMAVLHPSMRELLEPVSRAERLTRPSRLALVSTCMGLPILVTVANGHRSIVERGVLLVVMILLSAAAIWRVFRALRAHARSEQRLVFQATHDALTTLPNRIYLTDQLEQALVRHGGSDTLLAVLFLDVDRFKVVNDSMGHNLGDELLVAVAKRLRGVLPRDALIARVGGDEFVVVLERLRDVDAAVAAAETVRCCFVRPFALSQAELYATVSIGIAVAAPMDDASVETLLRDADTAMYQAKDGGRDAVAVFDRQMRDFLASRLQLERQLRSARQKDEFSIHYQPIIGLDSHSVVGVEALLRWTSPELGSVPPATFIPIAEDTGLIEEIGAWVLETACADLARWRAELLGCQDLFVSVNLSVRQLRNPNIVAVTRTALDRTGLPGDALHLELTESIFLRSSGVNHDTLDELREVGVNIAIDDFGTGYSSLAYLRHFPVDVIKIDKSFVDELDREDSAEESLVAAIVAMARALGKTTVAEGVEMPVQSKRLGCLGVDMAQGYVYARPTPVEEVPRLLSVLRQRESRHDVDVEVDVTLSKVR
jgi:diguanylate cyclase (GGDEF)-like protein